MKQLQSNFIELSEGEYKIQYSINHSEYSEKIAHLVFGKSKDTRTVFYVHKVWVKPEYQLQGLGLDLYDEMIEHVKSMNGKILLSDNIIEHPAVHRIYENLGAELANGRYQLKI